MWGFRNRGLICTLTLEPSLVYVLSEWLFIFHVSKYSRVFCTRTACELMVLYPRGSGQRSLGRNEDQDSRVLQSLQNMDLLKSWICWRPNSCDPSHLRPRCWVNLRPILTLIIRLTPGRLRDWNFLCFSRGGFTSLGPTLGFLNQYLSRLLLLSVHHSVIYWSVLGKFAFLWVKRFMITTGPIDAWSLLLMKSRSV